MAAIVCAGNYEVIILQCIKRTSCVFLTLIMFVFMSVSAFADFSDIPDGYAPDIVNDIPYFSTLLTSKCDSVGKDFMIDFFNDMKSGDSSDSLYIVYREGTSDSSLGSLYFLRSSVPLNIINLDNGNDAIKPQSGSLRSYRFTFDYIFDREFYPKGFEVGSQLWINDGVYDNSFIFCASNPTFSVPDTYMPAYDGLGFVDDDGLLDTLPEPGPEPEPEPEPEPTPTPNPPSFPTVPKVNNKYVPYDTTVWNGFSNSTRGVIGSIMPVLFKILAMIYGIIIVLSIIKAFVHPHKSSGGGGHGGNNGRLVKSIEYTYYD
jgi:hypothetical protein